MSKYFFLSSIFEGWLEMLSDKNFFLLTFLLLFPEIIGRFYGKLFALKWVSIAWLIISGNRLSLQVFLTNFQYE